MKVLNGTLSDLGGRKQPRLLSVAGVYGYLTFGKDVEADILMSYSGDDILMLIARLLFGISIITIYPIIVLLGRSGTPDKTVFSDCNFL